MKKIIGLVISLTIISGACAAVLAYVNSITALDYNFFMLLSAFYTFIGLASGIVVDLSYSFIDPRIRMGSKK